MVDRLQRMPAQLVSGESIGKTKTAGLSLAIRQWLSESTVSDNALGAQCGIASIKLHHISTQLLS